mmetsp:Transcript_56133/g.133741  ORF Transcript_56133/g.133741 Transcript_56133/m.133741 type:complete len:94 (+) Transcript_56133:278-559(+)
MPAACDTAPAAAEQRRHEVEQPAIADSVDVGNLVVVGQLVPRKEAVPLADAGTDIEEGQHKEADSVRRSSLEQAVRGAGTEVEHRVAELERRS